MVAVAVVAADAADALAIAWDPFGDAAADDPDGWEVTAAAAEVRPEPSLPADSTFSRATASVAAAADGAEPERVGKRVVHLHVPGEGQHVPALLVGDADRVLGERTGGFAGPVVHLTRLNGQALVLLP